MPRILIASLDLYNNVGGGQTVYQAIIEKRPDLTFYYPIQRESPDAHRPPNAIAFPLRKYYAHSLSSGPPLAAALYARFLDAMNLALSAAEAQPGLAFDVVDTPDYNTWGTFLRLALEHHGVQIGMVVLAMHGGISSALRDTWLGPFSHRSMAEIQAVEHLQFSSVDKRYALSETYANDWKAAVRLPVHMVDPLAFVSRPSPTPTRPGPPPDLFFVGRREKRKGPDVFVDLVWWLPPSSYGTACVLGPDDEGAGGVGSRDVLERAARYRQVVVELGGLRSQSELETIYRRRSVVVLPSRYDQFNLVALEALMRGCPIAVSRLAGVASYLRERHPSIPFVELDLNSSRVDSERLRGLLENYDRERDRLVTRIAELPQDSIDEALGELYSDQHVSSLQSRGELATLFHRYLLFDKQRVVADGPIEKMLVAGARSVNKHLTPESRDLARDTLITLRRRRLQPKPRMLLRETASRITGLPAKALQQATHMMAVDYHRGMLGHHLRERTAKEIDLKIEYLWSLTGARYVDRVPLFFELGRLERRRGNDIAFATYALRIMRWTGGDRFNQLDMTTEILRRHGYQREAEVATAMYGPACASPTARLSYLRAAFERHRQLPTPTFEFVDDQRADDSPRVAVIVSLYNAASKLGSFLDMLRLQTELAAGKLEIVLIDSGSPGQEYQVFKSTVEREALPVVYARTFNRETIQAAWNRGIALARAPYLAFLGADEGIHPEALGVLADELDGAPDIDWVISQSIVTSVDRHGIFDKDVMIYDRTGYDQDWHYLDTTFLSYVGGLYRRNIHERAGYYDESFRAAGDTEFKNRILPWIRSRAINRSLGVFNNYPDERTTEHPRAEIEDMRAWYLHRTDAGMQYAMGDDTTGRAERLLMACLRYRKCYTQHWSTDLDLALSLCRVLRDDPEYARYATVEADLQLLVNGYRHLEMLPYTTGIVDKRITRWRYFTEVWKQTKDVERRQAEFFGDRVSPAFEIFNDNRYEQHWWPWRMAVEQHDG